MMNLPSICLYFFILCWAAPQSLLAASDDNTSVIRIGTTPVILQGQTQGNDRLKNYISKKIGQKVQIVERSTYSQVISMLKAGQSH